MRIFICGNIEGDENIRKSRIQFFPDIIYACKWILTYVSVRVYKHLKKDRLGFYDLSATGQPERVGFLPHPTEQQLESPQSDIHLSKVR